MPCFNLILAILYDGMVKISSLVFETPGVLQWATQFPHQEALPFASFRMRKLQHAASFRAGGNCG